MRCFDYAQHDKQLCARCFTTFSMTRMRGFDYARHGSR